MYVRILASFFSLLIGWSTTAFAQGEIPISPTEENVLMSKSVFLVEADSNSGYYFNGERGAPNFSNINKRRHYYNKKRLAELKKLERAGDTLEYSQALWRYIKLFGIANFREEEGVAMIWKLGRLRQIMGDTAEAVFFYEIATKHTRSWGAPRLSFDSLTASTRSDWLPIDEYYKLLELRKKIDPLIPPKNVLQNMGKVINSKMPDYAPYMHPSDSVLIFSSRREQTDLIDPFGNENEELYYSIKNFISGKWEQAEKFSPDINSEFNEGSATLSPDGKTLFFTRCNSDDPNASGDCDIYVATYDRGNWIDIKNMGPVINTSSWDSQPNISEDGKILFFASNRKGGFGGIDIYFSVLRDDGLWTRAQNIGPVVNTSQDELSPFFHSINKTLYFGSTGQLKNYGGFDIFKSRWMGEQWEEPKNVGPLINTKVNEYYFSIDGKGENIFYASSKRATESFEDQDFDLYSFPMPMESRPDAVTKLSGLLIDSISGYPLVGAVMVVDIDNGVEIAPKRINAEGYFEFDLKKNNQYRIYVIGENFLTIREDIVLNNDTSFNIITESIDKAKPLVFESLEFELNSYRLSGYVKPKLDYIVRFLERYPMYKLSIEGHTDSDGNPEYNKTLSLQRAEQIEVYIEKEGNFDPDRIVAVGKGESEPLVPNDSYENKKKNRRVEFRMTIDPNFKGDMLLPMKEELEFNEEFLEDDPYDPEEFLREFDILDDEDDILNLDADLENEMEELLKEGDEKKKKPVKKKGTDK
jgi:outer membrane protein OmpA-like peptidoglycan-associated protein